ncbi:hypothetical protein [Halorubrum sp. N11]|uniref:hypothetical protein n=1 Tax=Halorubrum sp. N11 TaxID=3402276 RepID=UPI003EB88869
MARASERPFINGREVRVRGRRRAGADRTAPARPPRLGRCSVPIRCQRLLRERLGFAGVHSRVVDHGYIAVSDVSFSLINNDATASISPLPLSVKRRSSLSNVCDDIDACPGLSVTGQIRVPHSRTPTTV